MKAIHITIICVLAITGTAVTYAQPEIEWERRIDDYVNANCVSLVPLDDGVAAFGWGRDHERYYLVCVRYNEDGELVNYEAITPFYSSPYMRIVRAHDGGFIVKHGHTLRKVSIDFKLEWFMDYSDDDNTRFYDIIRAPDGYVAVGQINLENDHIWDGWFVKVNEEGEIVEERYFLDYLEEDDNRARVELNAIAAHPDSGFIIGYKDYYVDQYRNYRYHSYLIHIDENGDSLNVIAEELAERIFTDPYKIILGSYTQITLLSYEGERIKQATFEGEIDSYCLGTSLTLSSGGGGVIGGYTEIILDNDFYHLEIFLVRFDDQLNEMWWLYDRLQYGSGGAYAVCQGENGSYYIGGQKRRDDGEEPLNDFFVQKTTPDPTFVSEDDLAVTPRTLLLNPAYPNPFNSSVTITYETIQFSSVRLAVYDIRGRLVEELENRRIIKGHHRLTWTHNISGIYFVLLETGDTRVVKKIVCVP